MFFMLTNNCILYYDIIKEVFNNIEFISFNNDDDFAQITILFFYIKQDIQMF
jgi:hypothetical protein